MAANPEQTISVYVQLAEAYHGKNRYQERDRFLILAADTAWSAGRAEEAEQLRKKILTYNPNHLLRPYNSFGEALSSPDIMTYIQQLRRGYPVDRATELLRGLESSGGKPPRSEEDFSLPMDSSSPGKGKPAAKPAAPVMHSWPEVNTNQPVGRGQATRGDLGTIGAPPVENYGTLPAHSTRPEKPARHEPPPPRSAPAPYTLAQEPAPAPAKQRPVVLQPVPETPIVEEPDEEIYQSGAMVGGFLFLIVLLAGVVALGYVFVWPFFQAA